MIPLQQNTNSNQRARSCQEEIQIWWQNLPFFNKALISISTIISILNIFSGAYFYYLSNIPLYTIYFFNFWRIFTAPFTHQSIIQLLFSVWSIIGETQRLERQIGSVMFMGDFLIKNIFVQLGFLIIAQICSFFYSMFLIYPSSGLWVIVMYYLTLQSASNPENQTYFLCFPILIKMKYYPLAILAFFSLFSLGSGVFPVDMLAAMIMAYVEFRLFNGMALRLSQSKINSIEQKCLSSFSFRNDFVLGDNAGSANQLFQQNGGNQQQSYSQNLPRPGNLSGSQPGQLQQFFAGQGVSIGGNPQQQQQNQIQQQKQQQQQQQQQQSQQNRYFGMEQQNETQQTQSFSGKGVTIGGQNSQQQKNKDYTKVDQQENQNKSFNIEDNRII